MGKAIITQNMPIHVKFTWDGEDMMAHLDSMSLENIGERKIRSALRKEMKKAREHVMDKAKEAIPNDPRGAHKAIKVIVYKKALGANISLYDQKVRMQAINGSQSNGGRYGIYRRRRKVSARTRQINGYVGENRGFILRWVEGGTDGRFTKTLRYQAYRGVIRPRPFFKSATRTALGQAAYGFNMRLEKMIQRSIKSKAKAARG